MNCRRVAHDLTELREGDLPFVQRTVLRVHLALCPSCKAYAHQMDETTRALHEVDEPLPDEASRAIAERILRSRK